jgi:hypothetical protein
VQTCCGAVKPAPAVSEYTDNCISSRSIKIVSNEDVGNEKLKDGFFLGKYLFRDKIKK